MFVPSTIHTRRCMQISLTLHERRIPVRQAMQRVDAVFAEEQYKTADYRVWRVDLQEGAQW